ncbi:hypothetical protein C8K30_115102 [Promicromonospora sp. AC04]|uniref:hypothetical protein n=1 Tax=Promicromonospora sp. AC04 TaxID=2135723 RepID=UPI000D3C4A4A|nr:hypothetical protein [Promicromonospora sp. AC04]PUB20891.1 hypothetical protein C8K30_115102 [Promicromonospora sp. AC04]
MNDHHKPPKPWDLPVVRGLDAIRLLHGLEALHVGFDELHLHGEAPSGPMYTAVIHAYQPVISVPYTVRFAVQGTTYTVQGRDRQPLTTSGVADLLHVPTASADRAITLLKQSLTESLRIYNQANTPAQQGAGHPTPTVGTSQPWPFSTRASTDASPGPDL